MAHVPVSRTIAKRFGGEANLRMAVSKAVSGLTLNICDISAAPLFHCSQLCFGFPPGFSFSGSQTYH